MLVQFPSNQFGYSICCQIQESYLHKQLRHDDVLISEHIAEITYTKEVRGAVEESVQLLSKQLTSKGFGILANLDLQKKIREKTGHDVGGCVVLEVCNAEHARKALSAHKETVLALPCKVAVYENTGKVYVSFNKAAESIKQLGFGDLNPLAMQVDADIEEAINSIAID